MKKSALIKMLQEIEGDPEIKLWNGFAGDWVDINPKLEQVNLVRLTRDYWIESIRIEECIDRKDWTHQLPQSEVDSLKKSHRYICEWELNEYVAQEDIDKKRYQVKPVYILQAKVKGETTYDRLGDMSY
jgi:hypothetical protein